MFIFIHYRHLVALWAVLLMLANIPSAYGQTGFRFSGRTCVPDQECKADSVTFTDSALAGVTTRVWDFGDGSTVTKQRDSVARHVYQQPGTFTVRLTRTVNGVTQTVEKFVSVFPRPQPFSNWRTDTTICQGEVITLDPYPNGAPAGLIYKWYPKGDTTQTIQVDSSGCYSVEAIDPTTGCSYQDRINVDVCGEQKQSQGVKWYFGNNAGLDFSGGGTPSPIDDGKLSTIEGSSSIANTKGELLFYTDGITIYDADGKPMRSLVPGDTAQVGIPLGGNRNSTQSALIVPKPTCRGCEYLYYVYTTAEIRGKRTLTYSVVDMRESQGKGAIVEKNIPVTENGTEQSASVKNERDSTYWVITRIYGTNRFEVRNLNRSEDTTPKTYEGGQVIDSLAKGEGYIKIGPADTTGGQEGNRPMAVVVPGPPKNSIDLFTFNDSLGTIKFERTIDLGPAPPKAYGVEFSPDGKSLYVTMLADTNADGSQKGASYILKYDLNQRDSLLTGSRTVVDSSTTRQYGSLQIGPDGRIYVAIEGSTSLGTIENPNGGLLDSLQFIPNGQSLGGKTSQLGLPNLVDNFNDQSSGPGFTYADTCATSPTTFQASPNCPKLKETYTWNFGDGSRPVSTTALQPQLHTYQRAGDYPVSLQITTRTAQGAICKDTTIRDTITIVDTPAKMELGENRDVCDKRGVTLDAQVEARNYVWVINGAVAGRQKTITLTRPGYYYVVGIAANGGCFESDTIELRIFTPPPLDLGPDTVFCYRSSVNLTVPQQTWSEFEWSTGSKDRSTTVSKAGEYYVTAKNFRGCINSDTINVTELPKLNLRAALTGPSACTTADGVIELTPTPAGRYIYVWSRADGAVLPGTTNRQANLPEGSYAINATDSLRGCEADTLFSLKSPVNNLAITPAVRPALCSIPNSGTINVTVQGGTPVGYIWLDQNNNPVSTSAVFGQAAPGLYGVQVTDSRGCKAFSDSIRVGLDSTGFASLGPNRLRCVGDTVQLVPQDGALASNQYQWSTGQTSRLIIVNQPGTYSVVVRNPQTGCVGRSSVQVGDRPAPPVSLVPEASICEGDNGRIQLTPNGGSNLRYIWPQTGDTTRSITVSRVGEYAVRVTDPAGCTATVVTRVVNRCEPRVNIPDAFTPNGDGVNDLLQVYTSYVTDYELRIYNRWGEVIFVSNSPEQKWDGTYKGTAYPPMLYPYVISYKSESFPERGKTTKRGSVLVIR
ncbi:PKD domain-containing protein [Fibrisoma montanum]|uniref:PKD domain-containing protein n=1 Tax=Fibrisoma montanum TaxID=2305895 RepID=UPI0018F6E37F|nr:PKD domain-containing protein [Fibrisoma montanum]